MVKFCQSGLVEEFDYRLNSHFDELNVTIKTLLRQQPPLKNYLHIILIFIHI